MLDLLSLAYVVLFPLLLIPYPAHARMNTSTRSNPSSPDSAAAYESLRERVISQLGPASQAYIRSLPPDAYTIDEHEVTRDMQRRGEYGDYDTCVGGMFAQTLDDGVYDYSEGIAEAFAAEGHRITFFINGNNYACSYDKPYVSYMRHNLHRHGAQYGNHLWSHPHAPDLSDDEFREQVGLVEELLLRTVGVKPKALRFPYGEFTPRQMEIAHQMGYYTVGWNKDYKDASKHSSIEHTRAVIKSLVPGDIVLAHDAKPVTAHQAVPSVLRHLRKRNMVSKTIHECLGFKGSPYQITVHHEARNDAWTCEGKPMPDDG